MINIRIFKEVKSYIEALFILSFLIVLVFLLLLGCSSNSKTPEINREELVQRHIVQVNNIDSLSSLSVGNGRFAFTVDFTGLQTFPEKYERGIPLGTQSEWGWHSFPNISNYTFEESLREYDFHGRKITYDVQWDEAGRKQDAANYFRQNPHRLHLAIIGLDLIHPDGSPVGLEEIDSIYQVLNPWNGEIHSYFTIKGVPVEVITYAHQNMDIIAANIKSPLIEQRLLRVKLCFPYPSGQHTDNGCDWSHPEKHTSMLKHLSKNSAIIHREMDTTSYNIQLLWSEPASIAEKEPHRFFLVPELGQKQFSFTCFFSPIDTIKKLPDFIATAQNNQQEWKAFWLSVGAVDFSGSTDHRAFELERRIILSQYLTKIQCTGTFPPQETGLTCNSWFGKFHLEMHWWHAVHFALWNRTDLLEKSLDYYMKIAPKAEETAKRQGFEGYRWPKMTDPSGDNSPSIVGSFLIWQQPHFIYMAELCYRDGEKKEVMQKYANLVFATAEFMASYAWYDGINKRYILGPTLIPVQERFPAETTINPPFELVYWHWGLTTAQQWRERLGLERNSKWDEVLKGLSPLAQKDGLYLAAENAPDSYTNPPYTTDHPMVLGTFGMLPASPLVDTIIMKQTFDYVWENWTWSKTWGWDFPMVAMSATRLGLPKKALDALFINETANTWLPNGHNYQNEKLCLYLPGNGGLLTAIAMMCAGYDGSNTDNPGFPEDGTWIIRWEGIKKLP
jgi:hypothetical protein